MERLDASLWCVRLSAEKEFATGKMEGREKQKYQVLRSRRRYTRPRSAPGYLYTRKNAQVVTGVQTSCYKSVH